MSATKTLAFILRTQDYRDTSLMAELFTREHGKIRGIIRGIRDTRGHFGSTLEPFSLNEILFYKRRRGGDLHQVTQVDLVDSFTSVREDLERLAYATYFTELVSQLVDTEEPAPDLFDLMHEAILFLGSGASSKRSARIFEIKLLEKLGLAPEMRACVSCAKENPEPAYFVPTLGGLQCKECSVSKGGSLGIPISRGTVQFFDKVKRSEVKDLAHVKVAQEVGEDLEKMLRRFVDYQLPYKLKSVVFLEKMGFN